MLLALISSNSHHHLYLFSLIVTMLKLSHAKFAIINCAIFAIIGTFIYNFSLQDSSSKVMRYFRLTDTSNSSSNVLRQSANTSTTTILTSKLTKNYCSAKKNVAFVKTHKCASSTIQNMLMRYAYEKNLTVVLPTAPQSNYLSRTSPFNHRSIIHAPWANKGYNILCHHIVYNHEEVQKIMPDDSVYLTILREPVSMFESLYSYVRFEKYYRMDINQFINNTANITKRMLGHLGRNQMLFDLGYPVQDFDDFVKVKNYIKKMEKHFSLVLIAEHFDQSLILLKKLLCWNIDDIITFKLNARKDSKRLHLSNYTKTKISEWSAADVLVYDHFLKMFHQKVKEYGEGQMKKDVEELRSRRKEWFTYCIQGIYDSTKLSKLSKLYSRDVWGFEVKRNVNNETCDSLAVAELQQTEKIRQRQFLQSLPFHLQSQREYKLLVQGKGPIPDLNALSPDDKEKVLQIASLIYPGRAAYLNRQVSMPKKDRLKVPLSS